jgi:hypothetical protein
MIIRCFFMFISDMHTSNTKECHTNSSLPTLASLAVIRKPSRLYECVYLVGMLHNISYSLYFSYHLLVSSLLSSINILVFE